MNKHTQPKPFLDLFSTSDAVTSAFPSFSDIPCIYHAPFFAYQTIQKTWTVVQGNCHHWDCPRCGIGRAKHEYGRIVEGCKTLAKTMPLFFLTPTCKGAGLSVNDAEKNYLKWTTKLLKACRSRCQRSGGNWYYVQVTERQKRQHPHSHILTTFNVGDLRLRRENKWITDRDGKKLPSQNLILGSHWLEGQLKRSGLGEQYDISIVETVEGASRYVAKYLFKDSIFETTWPKGWKRVRYSQSFPKLEKQQTTAFVLLQHDDWYKLAKIAVVVHCTGLEAFAEATNQMHFHDVIIRLKREENQ